MAITGIDHIYAETTEWERSAEFWEALGFDFVDRWGSDGHRAGRLECGDAVVVLAEVTGRTPQFNVYFAVSDPDALHLPETVTVVDPPHETHWGTRVTRITDPDGRVHSLEGPA